MVDQERDECREITTEISAAIKLADVTRKIVLEQDEKTKAKSLSQDSEYPSALSHLLPGTIEGLSVAFAAAIVLNPVKSYAVRSLGKNLGGLSDAIFTTFQVFFGMQLGIYSFSLVGSQHYLARLSDSSGISAETTDLICQHGVVSRSNELRLRGNFDTSWNPLEDRVLAEWRRALQVCNNRSDIERFDK